MHKHTMSRCDLMKLANAATAVSAFGTTAGATGATDITSLSELDLSQAIHDRKVSCVEVLTAYLK